MQALDNVQKDCQNDDIDIINNVILTLGLSFSLGNDSISYLVYKKIKIK